MLIFHSSEVSLNMGIRRPDANKNAVITYVCTHPRLQMTANLTLGQMYLDALATREGLIPVLSTSFGYVSICLGDARLTPPKSFQIVGILCSIKLYLVT